MVINIAWPLASSYQLLPVPSTWLPVGEQHDTFPQTVHDYLWENNMAHSHRLYMITCGRTTWYIPTDCAWLPVGEQHDTFPQTVHDYLWENNMAHSHRLYMITCGRTTWYIPTECAWLPEGEQHGAFPQTVHDYLWDNNMVHFHRLYMITCGTTTWCIPTDCTWQVPIIFSDEQTRDYCNNRIFGSFFISEMSRFSLFHLDSSGDPGQWTVGMCVVMTFDG